MREIEGTENGPDVADKDIDVESNRLYALMNMLAHEIRNPLNALVMNLKLLNDRVSDDKGREILQTATEQTRRTNRILNDFLRFARPRKPEPLKFDLTNVLNDIKTFVAPQLKERGIKLHLNPIDEPTELFTDKDLLGQILLNLVLNSIEAVPDGNIYIEIAKTDGTTSISVTDDGPGFLELSRAFEPFYSTKDDGVGLGLAIVNSLVKTLGGSVTATNARDGGAVVEIKISDFPEK
jgi:two-component system sensor histidine kinase HydH